MISATMHAKLPTIAELRKGGYINSYEIVAAIDAFMRDPTADPYQFGSGHSLDVAALVASTIDPVEIARRVGPQEKAYRNAVAGVVMAAHPIVP